MARVALPQSKIRARRKRKRITIAAIIAACIVVFFAFCAWVSHAQFMRIDTITVLGAQTVLQNDVQAAVRKDLAGSYGLLFPKDNIFLYPKAEIVQDLTKEIPTIEQDQIKVVNFHTIAIVITERTKKALWCPSEDQSLLTNLQDCALLDQNGVVYASALSASSSIVYFGPLTGNKFPHTYLPADQFHSLSALVDALMARSQQATDTPVSVAIVGSDVHVQYQSGFTLIFLLSSAGADVYNHFLLALTSDVFQGKQLSDFQYLDLRFGDKLYYKLK